MTLRPHPGVQLAPIRGWRVTWPGGMVWCSNIRLAMATVKRYANWSIEKDGQHLTPNTPGLESVVAAIEAREKGRAAA